ncbi:MAG: hypothetical protein AAF927_01785 [Bacteroidota bacterium]
MQNTASPSSLMSFLKHPITYLIGMVFIMAWTGVHSFKMYQFSRPDASPIELGLVVFGIVAIEFLVLIFTINDNKEAAMAYAFATFTITLFVHWMEVSLPDKVIIVDGFTRTLEGRAFEGSNWLYFLPGLIYALLFSFGQYYMADRFYQYELELEEAKRFPVNQGVESITEIPENVLEVLENELSILRDKALSNHVKWEQAEGQKISLETQLSELRETSISMEKVTDIASVLQCAMDEIIRKEGLLHTKLDTLRKNAANWKQRVFNGHLRGDALINAKFKMELYNRAYSIVKSQEKEVV